MQLALESPAVITPEVASATGALVVVVVDVVAVVAVGKVVVVEVGTIVVVVDWVRPVNGVFVVGCSETAFCSAVDADTVAYDGASMIALMITTLTTAMLHLDLKDTKALLCAARHTM
jgi:hypothetical protein